MKTVVHSVLAMVMLATAAATSLFESADGSKVFDGTFLGYSEKLDKVALRIDGKKVVVKMSDLSEDTRVHVLKCHAMQQAGKGLGGQVRLERISTNEGKGPSQFERMDQDRKIKREPYALKIDITNIQPESVEDIKMHIFIFKKQVGKIIPPKQLKGRGVSYYRNTLDTKALGLLQYRAVDVADLGKESAIREVISTEAVTIRQLKVTGSQFKGVDSDGENQYVTYTRQRGFTVKAIPSGAAVFLEKEGIVIKSYKVGDAKRNDLKLEKLLAAQAADETFNKGRAQRN